MGMMDPPDGKWTIRWIIVAAIFFFAFLLYDRTSRPTQNVNYTMPPHPGVDVEGGYWRYDYQQRIWIKQYFEADRTMGNKRTNKQDADALDDYLKRKVKGYYEDTYWGEEYDLDSDEND